MWSPPCPPAVFYHTGHPGRAVSGIELGRRVRQGWLLDRKLAAPQAVAEEAAAAYSGEVVIPAPFTAYEI